MGEREPRFLRTVYAAGFLALLGLGVANLADASTGVEIAVTIGAGTLGALVVQIFSDGSGDPPTGAR